MKNSIETKCITAGTHSDNHNIRIRKKRERINIKKFKLFNSKVYVA